MTEELLNEFLSIDIKEILCLKKQPQGNLEDCLKLLDKNRIEVICHNWLSVPTDFRNKAKCLEFLKETLINKFKENIMILPITSVLELLDFINGKRKDFENDTLIKMGIVFVYKQNNKFKYYVPDDIKELFQTKLDKETLSTIEANSFLSFASTMLFVCGLISIDELFKIYQKNNKIINKEAIDKALKKGKIISINGKEYLWNRHFKFREEYKDFVNMPLSDSLELDKETYYMISISIKISNLKDDLGIKDNEFVLDFIQTVFPEPMDFLETSNILASKYHLNKRQKNILTNNLIALDEEICYWCFRGRTKAEVDMELFTLTELPKDETLMSYLKVLNKEALDLLFEQYNVLNINDLREAILTDFEEYVYSDLSDIDDGSFIDDDYLDSYQIRRGYYYFYNNIKYIPKEIFEEYNKMDDANFINDIDYVNEYILMYGMIKRKDLQKILREHHNINYSLEELDEIVDFNDFIIEDNYYLCMENIREFESIILEQSKNDKYKIIDEHTNQEMLENDLEEEIQDHLKGVIPITKIDIVISSIFIALHLGILDKDMLKNVFDSEHIHLKNNTFDKLYDIAKKYKNNFALWIHKGNSFNDLYQKGLNKKID